MVNFLRFSRLVSDLPPRPGVRVSVFLSVHTFRSLWLPPARWLMFHFALCYLISSKTLPWPSVSLSTSSWPPLTCDWMLSLWPIPVCSGCCNKLRFTDRWLLRNRNLLLTGLEAAKFKLRCPQIRCLVAARCLGHRRLSPRCVSHSHGRRARGLWGAWKETHSPQSPPSRWARTHQEALWGQSITCCETPELARQSPIY